LEQSVAGPLDVNAYLVIDGGEGLLVDCPEGSLEWALRLLAQKKARLRYVVLTHGHFDHIHDATKIQKATGCALAVHRLDAALCRKPDDYGFGIDTPPCEPDLLLCDEDSLRLGSLDFRVLHTPGHSPGGLCLYCEKEGVLFSGDLLFANTVGRTDLPGSDFEAMKKSLNRVLALPSKTRVLPGHGRQTSVGAEKAGLSRLL